MIDEKLQKKVDELSAQERDDIYRYLWAQHVREDVESYSKNIGVVLDETEKDSIANLYVYDGEYDCNLTYWENIENLINQVTK